MGGLMPNINIKELFEGVSAHRNPKLSNVFYRLKLIEAYGTGLRKIMEAYDGTGKEPLLKITENIFMLILPNVNYNNSLPEDYNKTLLSDAQKVISIAKQNFAVTRKEVQEFLGVSQATAGRLLRDMVNEGLLVQEGHGKSTKYLEPLRKEHYQNRG